MRISDWSSRVLFRSSWRDDKLVFPGLLDDYANMMRAALALFEATGSPDYLAQARAWGAVVESDYADAVNGGYFLTAKNAEALVARTRTAADNATPSDRKSTRLNSSH